MDEAAAVDSSAPAEFPTYRYWCKEIDLARKRHRNFWKEADRTTQIYEAAKRGQNSFNILYSNTETLLPSCFNQLPRPIAERRYKDADPLGRAAAIAMERMLEYQSDAPPGQYDTFHALLEQAVLSGLVPGRGVTRFHYLPEFAPTSTLGDAASSEGSGPQLKEEETGREPPEGTEPLERVAYETVYGEDVATERFLTGYARLWCQVPWIAYLHDMTEEDAEVNFGKELAHELKYEEAGPRDSDGQPKGEDQEGERVMGSTKTVRIWEIWQKSSRKIFFFCPTYPKKMLKTVDDPLKLSGFYDCPEPLAFFLRSSTVIPQPLYMFYEEQAKELNRVTQRLNKVLEAIKVRGFYDGTALKGLDELNKRDDATLLAMPNAAALTAQGADLNKLVWLMPLDMLVKVYQQLVLGRDAIKQTIYEITGIADIMRGAGLPSETATLTQAKNQWGTLKVKRMQSEVQRYARDCLRIIGELCAEHFDEESWRGMTNLDYATEEDIAKAEMTMQQVTQAQLAMPPPPAQGDSPGAAAPPGLPPFIQQAMQEAQATLSKPRWKDVMDLLRNDFKRSYRIDIETNSTIEATSQEDKQNITEAMTAMANTAQSFQPLVEAGALPMAMFKQMMLTVVRRFQFGRQVEDAVMAMPDQLPERQDPKMLVAQAKLEGDKQKAQLDAQAKQAEIAGDQQLMQAELQKMREEMALKEKEHAAELAFREREFQQEAAHREREAVLEYRLRVMEGQQEMAQREQEGEWREREHAQDLAIRGREAEQGLAIRDRESRQKAQNSTRERRAKGNGSGKQ